MTGTPTFTFHGWLRAMTARLRSSRPSPKDDHGPVRLQPGTLWSLHLHDEHLTLTCGEGQLWLTREDDPNDHVLRAGDSLPLSGAGHVVVQALRPSRFCLSP
jgi:hypothetical protein